MKKKLEDYKRQLNELFVLRDIYFTLKTSAGRISDFEDTHDLLPEVKESLDKILTVLDNVEHELIADISKLKDKIDNDYKKRED